MPISTPQEIIDDIRAGKMVILMDDEDRENEGDLIMAAEHITPEAINFMATHGRGLICLTMTKTRCESLGLPPMVQDNNAQYTTNLRFLLKPLKVLPLVFLQLTVLAPYKRQLRQVQKRRT